MPVISPFSNKYIVIFILAFCFGCLGCQTSVQEIEETFAFDFDEIEKAEKVVIRYTDSAVLKAIVKGDELVRYTEGNRPGDEFTKGIEVEFYGPDQSIQSWLTAKYAFRDLNHKKIVVRDSVVLRNVKGEKLETIELIWLSEEAVVKTDKFVKITRADGTILYGYGFESNDNFTQHKILAPEGPVNIRRLKRTID